LLLSSSFITFIGQTICRGLFHIFKRIIKKWQTFTYYLFGIGPVINAFYNTVIERLVCSYSMFWQKVRSVKYILKSLKFPFNVADSICTKGGK
jgi:hypothetical protein